MGGYTVHRVFANGSYGFSRLHDNAGRSHIASDQPNRDDGRNAASANRDPARDANFAGIEGGAHGDDRTGSDADGTTHGDSGSRARRHAEAACNIVA